MEKIIAIVNEGTATKNRTVAAGRDAWVLKELVMAGDRGCTAIGNTTTNFHFRSGPMQELKHLRVGNHRLASAKIPDFRRLRTVRTMRTQKSGSNPTAGWRGCEVHAARESTGYTSEVSPMKVREDEQ